MTRVCVPTASDYGRIVTGLPSGACIASWRMTSFGTRMQPFEMSLPISLLFGVPWTANWPCPPWNDVRTSEYPEMPSA